MVNRYPGSGERIRNYASHQLRPGTLSRPPPDSTVVPVMYEFFSETRKAAIQPISSGSAKRLSNDIPASDLRTWSTAVPRKLATRSARGPQLSVLTVPGARLLTSTLNGARSLARSLVKPMIAEFVRVVEYAPGESNLPDTPEMLSMRPALDFLRGGTANLVVYT